MTYLQAKSVFFIFQLNFVRFYLPMLEINHKRVIYLDDDVIVQGTYAKMVKYIQSWLTVSDYFDSEQRSP